MEFKEKLILSESRAFYICKHLEELSQETILFFKKHNYDFVKLEKNKNENNSIFSKNFCDNPFKLFEIFQSLKPKSEIIQSNGNIALLFENESNVFWGLDTLISVDMLTPQERNSIRISKKSGFSIKSIDNIKPLPTKDAVLVFNSLSNQIITIYPGRYAPPFPNSLKTLEEQKESLKFWEMHVFIDLK